MMYHGFFVLLQWIEVTLSKTYWKKKKRYAYLVLENVGNFQIRIQGWHSGSHAIAWAAITISVRKGFLRTSIKDIVALQFTLRA